MTSIDHQSIAGSFDPNPSYRHLPSELARSRLVAAAVVESWPAAAAGEVIVQEHFEVSAGTAAAVGADPLQELRLDWEVVARGAVQDLQPPSE